MVELSRRMPHVTAFPHALGTGLLIHTGRPLDDGSRQQIGDFIDEYESALSRFRSDSLVAAMASAEFGGTFTFPDWTLPLFKLYDILATASAGAIDPCIGEDMIWLGYGADLTFTMQPDAANHLGAIHGRPTWERDVARDGATLRTTRPVQLDFGACGKGYLVDLLGMMLRKQFGSAAEFLIDAGGDMLIDSRGSIDIALEDPFDTNNAIGIAHISSGVFCASAPSRRHWGEAHRLRLHHLLNAIDGQPVNDIAAAWAYVNANSSSINSPNADSPSATRAGTRLPTTAFPGIEYPTALADGLATALFVTEPQCLTLIADFSCAQLLADRHMVASRNFPATFFTTK
ncbi:MULTISPECIES: FAD:protein FMN transferase [Bifidobacterium]|uniref:FAD:protein FMN transferase n=1 Tax=Bifidobacterium tibiigranuli TaxID=2172043 RepID=A0A5N6S7B8_9BIFI|nr:FAD:protein FMN transferase [Bifidobacterium tibiigranuli]KAE8129303.1 FAD:protein FMN transferase [Bifidobacterium tibiigranuli]KAE8129540.1 FAD:protein FMN transferase [Bifidobacterium tibiigranuli]MCH3975429.1 FAD:protein FMN transferase [Bifidobacterium tibiigranuli]MCH4189673.1 FAD:protein FMN transferase [Bifidobacterium tibiigranuli]MCH4204212.1 FAD:protein FMN transferase [Bifidobacterium tibiigranuli]